MNQMEMDRLRVTRDMLKIVEAWYEANGHAVGRALLRDGRVRPVARWLDLPWLGLRDLRRAARGAHTGGAAMTWGRLTMTPLWLLVFFVNLLSVFDYITARFGIERVAPGYVPFRNWWRMRPWGPTVTRLIADPYYRSEWDRSND